MGKSTPERGEGEHGVRHRTGRWTRRLEGRWSRGRRLWAVSRLLIGPTQILKLSGIEGGRRTYERCIHAGGLRTLLLSMTMSAIVGL